MLTHAPLKPENGRGVVIDGLFQRPRFGMGSRADFDDFDPDLAHGMVIAIAVRLVDDYLVFEAGQVRQLGNRRWGTTGDTGCRGQY